MYYLKREIHSQYEWCLLTPHLVADKQVSIGFWNTSMCFLSMIFPGRRMELQSCYYIVLWMLILYIFVTLILAFCSKTLCVWKLNLASFCLVRCNAIKGVFIMCKCIKCGYEIIPLILEPQEMLYLNITQLCRPLYLEYDSRCALYKGNMIWFPPPPLRFSLFWNCSGGVETQTRQNKQHYTSNCFYRTKNHQSIFIDEDSTKTIFLVFLY